MTGLYNKLINNKLFYILISLIGILYLLSFYHRYIEDDEAVLGEYSYYFLHEGIARLKTMPAILNFDERMFAHHRFYTWSGALIIQIFGWSIYALKTSTLVWYALFFFLLYKYFQISDVENKKQHFIIGAFIIFTAPIILIKSFSFRPDILLMTEGLAVLYFIKRYRVQSSLWNVVFAGALAGLGFLTHLNGIAFCVAGFFLLLILKEFKALWVFTVAGAVVGGLYFIELLPPGNFNTFIYQLTNWPTVNHGENYMAGGGMFSLIESRVLKLLSEHKRFFWGDKVIAFSALFIVALIFNFRSLRAKDKEVLYFVLLLIPALNIFGSHVAERYLLFYYGPMVIITAIWIYDLKFKKSGILQGLTVLIVILHLVFGVKNLYNIYQLNYDTIDVHKEILGKIEKPDAKVLAPYAFIYNEFENYDLYAFKTYEYLQEDLTEPMSQEWMLSKAASLGMDYIIISDEMKKEIYMQWISDWELDTNKYYEVFYKDDDYLILRRK